MHLHVCIFNFHKWSHFKFHFASQSLTKVKSQRWGCDVSALFPLLVPLSFVCLQGKRPAWPSSFTGGSLPCKEHCSEHLGSDLRGWVGSQQYARALLALPSSLLVTAPRDTQPSHPHPIGLSQLSDRDRKGHLVLLDFSSNRVLMILRTSLCDNLRWGDSSSKTWLSYSFPVMLQGAVFLLLI